MDSRYVMSYSGGEWVRKDISTGPMSTGGYPSKTTDLHMATVWETKMDALRYRATMAEDWAVHRLVLSTVAETITPAEEAEARGDEEFKEYQRLAAKYGQTGVGRCPYIVPWVGKCDKAPSVGELFCDKHVIEKCFRCGAQATRGCDHTGQFVCGVPRCEVHKHHG